MKFKSVVVLTVDEARSDLVDHFTEFLVVNRSYLKTLLREGKLNELPNFDKATASEIMSLYRENNVGSAIVGDKVDTILVQNGTTLEVVYEKPEPTSLEKA